jgi:S1-C subfamily serine protease
MKILIKCLLILIFLQFLILGCAKRIYKVAYPTLSDGKYDSEFPYKSCSAQLEKISKTVRKISAIAYYKSYVMAEDSQITENDIYNKDYLKKAVREVFYNNSVIGTATVIQYTGRTITLLTCAHVVNFADTIITYFSNDEGKPTTYIQSIAFKQRQDNFVADLPERGQLEILLMDIKRDIALLGKRFTSQTYYPIPVFDYPLGKAKTLEWGSFVYLMGYPKGYQMVTKGIVSLPNRDKDGSFLVDALFNKGFSGGIVLAIKDGIPNFELVGIANSVSADYEYVMSPPEYISRIGYNSRIPYHGDIYVEFDKIINYGITFIISMESIKSCIRENESVLLDKGYDLSSMVK